MVVMKDWVYNFEGQLEQDCEQTEEHVMVNFYGAATGAEADVQRGQLVDSANIGGIVTMDVALHLVQTNVDEGAVVCIFFGSDIGNRCARGGWNVSLNRTLVEEVREKLTSLSYKYDIYLQKLAVHSGNGIDRADANAKRGVSGETAMMPSRRVAPVMPNAAAANSPLVVAWDFSLKRLTAQQLNDTLLACARTEIDNIKGICLQASRLPKQTNSCKRDLAPFDDASTRVKSLTDRRWVQKLKWRLLRVQLEKK